MGQYPQNVPSFQVPQRWNIQANPEMAQMRGQITNCGHHNFFSHLYLFNFSFFSQPITTTTTTTTTTTSDNLICPKADLLRHSFEVNKKCHCRFSYCMEHHRNLLPDPYRQENYDEYCPDFAKLVFNINKAVRCQANTALTNRQ